MNNVLFAVMCIECVLLHYFVVIKLLKTVPLLCYLKVHETNLFHMRGGRFHAFNT